MPQRPQAYVERLALLLSRHSCQCCLEFWIDPRRKPAKLVNQLRRVGERLRGLCPHRPLSATPMMPSQ
jgi:hypothetical protein